MKTNITIICGVLIGLQIHFSKQVVLAVKGRNNFSANQNIACVKGQSCVVE